MAGSQQQRSITPTRGSRRRTATASSSTAHHQHHHQPGYTPEGLPNWIDIRRQKNRERWQGSNLFNPSIRWILLYARFILTGVILAALCVLRMCYDGVFYSLRALGSLLLGWKYPEWEGKFLRMKLVNSGSGSSSEAAAAVVKKEITPFPAPLWNPHVATIGANLRPWVPLKLHREMITSWDGCPICLDWTFATSQSTGGRLNQAKGVVMLIPGLASSCYTCYVQGHARQIANSGYHCAIMNSRGTGDTPLTTPRVITGYVTDDIRWVVRDGFNPKRLEETYGIPQSTPFFIIGHSLGGSQLTKYLGEEGEKYEALKQKIVKMEEEGDYSSRSDSDDEGEENSSSLEELKLQVNDPAQQPILRIKRAVVNNVPWDFHATCAWMMRRTQMTVYQQHLTDGLIEYLEQHKEMIRTMKCFDIDALLKKGFHKVQDYDAWIATPFLGFKDKEEYYDKSQPYPFLPHTRTKMLVIATRDDPIIGPVFQEKWWEKTIQKAQGRIEYLAAPAGGHLAYVMGWWKEMMQEGNPMEESCTNFFDEDESVSRRH